jgi:hypothetical protein
MLVKGIAREIHHLKDLDRGRYDIKLDVKEMDGRAEKELILLFF